MRELFDIAFITTSTNEVAFGNQTFRDKDHLAQVLARREKLAGRTLDNNTLARGVIQDHRGSGEKIRAGHGTMDTWKNEDSDPNVYRSRAVAELLAHEAVKVGAPVDRKKLYRQAEIDEDKRLAAKAAAEAKANEPDRVRLRDAAAEALEFARFSRDSNVDILYQVTRLIEDVERDDDLASAKKSYVEIMDALQANATARRAQLESEVELLRGRAEFEQQ